MRTNLRVILASMAAAALLATPAVARTARHSHAAPYAYAQPYFVPSAPYRAPSEGGPYTPSKPAPAYGSNSDFQDGVMR
jgi:hypothetical protein